MPLLVQRLAVTKTNLGFLKVCCKKFEVEAFGDKKISKKKSHSAEKKSTGGPFTLVRFRKCMKKFLAQAGTRTRNRWVLSQPI